MIYGFSTNITPLKGVDKQDWNFALLMIQKLANTMLATENTGRWIALSTARNENEGAE